MTHIVADEIYFQGYRVAILTEDAPATVLGDFEDGMNSGTLFEVLDTKNKEGMTQDEVKDTVSCETVQEVWEIAKRAARGGLLNLKDFRKLLEAQGNTLT